jgi:hypothetical protein
LEISGGFDKLEARGWYDLTREYPEAFILLIAYSCAASIARLVFEE